MCKKETIKICPAECLLALNFKEHILSDWVFITGMKVNFFLKKISGQEF